MMHDKAFVDTTLYKCKFYILELPDHPGNHHKHPLVPVDVGWEVDDIHRCVRMSTREVLQTMSSQSQNLGHY